MKFLEHNSNILKGEPYENDLLENRKKFGDTLINFINMVEDGCVIAIDAKWGEGKTTFAKWWAKDLEDVHVPIYFNAFANDINNEPLLAITKVIFTKLDDAKKFSKETSDAFKKLSEELIPALLSLSAISAATIAFGPEGAVSSSIATSGIKTIGNFVKNYLNKEKQKSLEELIFNFKNSLEIITSQLFLNNQKKLVFIIDELDRCRPTYAVEVIEKIKHLFSVAGVIWVLVLNKDQMEKSIKHIYGTIDTNEYLTKFIDVTTPLPKDVINYNRYLSDHYNKLVNGLIDSTEMDCVIKDSAKRFLSELARLFGLSIRETQKVVLSLQLILGKCSDWTDWYIIIALFYTILKVNKFNLYLQVKNNTIGYIRLSDKLDILKESSSCKKPINWLPFYVENSMRINNDTDSKTQAHNDYGQNSEDEYKKFTNQEYDFLEVDDKYKKDIFCKLDLFNFD